METCYYKSPIGIIRILYSETGIGGLYFQDGKTKIKSAPELFAIEYIQQIEAYFKGQLKQFDLPVDLQGTEFQLRVWNELMNIPYGQTISYMDLAKRLGNPKSIRAAAHANAKNPISIIIPCHRVIGSDGRLTGYAGGLWRKKWLLELEKQGRQQRLF